MLVITTSKHKMLKHSLVAAGLGPFDMKPAFDYLIYTLEWNLNPKDGKAEKRKSEAQTREPFEPEFHIPAVTCWLEHTGWKL